MYKRPGHRVIINSRGDLIVRPSYAEASVQRTPGGEITPANPTGANIARSACKALPLALAAEEAALLAWCHPEPFCFQFVMSRRP